VSLFVAQGPLENEFEVRLQLTYILAPNYMTTSTATVPATVLADALNDANRLKAAVDAVLRTL
jgi:hypothetical protein